MRRRPLQWTRRLGEHGGFGASEHPFPLLLPPMVPSTAATADIITGAGQGTEAIVTDSKPVLSWALSPDNSPFVGAVGSSRDRRHLRHKVEILRPASQGHAHTPHEWALRLLAESLEGTLLRWEDTL